MTNRDGSPSSPSFVRLLMRAAVAGGAAGLFALLAVQAGVWLTPPAPGVVGANIGLGMLALAAQPVVGSLLAWAGLRLLGVPSPGRSALVAVPFYVAFLWPLMVSDAAATLPSALDSTAAWMLSYAVVEGAVPMLLATMAGTACVRALTHRRPTGAATEGS
ncbi:hypothetical protein ACFOVU_19530 [Nocardiopsis sediminis]|uniref:Transporter n=1 Tax=Nocardiopsis sediminis TaxID=1778267 RepID=A0ABV8FTY9_9ACTN